MIRPPPISTLFPYTTLSRSPEDHEPRVVDADLDAGDAEQPDRIAQHARSVAGSRPERDPRRATVARDACRRRRSEEHTSELQSRQYLVCRLLLEKKITITKQ